MESIDPLNLSLNGEVKILGTMYEDTVEVCDLFIRSFEGRVVDKIYFASCRSLFIRWRAESYSSGGIKLKIS